MWNERLISVSFAKAGQAIGLACSLGQLPPHLIVYAIEGKNFTAGTDLSSEVENAMREVVEKVMGEVQEYRLSTHWDEA